jgi:predicted nuclease of predicted toxin-antitoxin system
MKLLLDQGLPRSTVKHLALAGVAAENVGDIGMARADDEMILDAARQRQSVVVTWMLTFIRSSRLPEPSHHPSFESASKV